MQVTAFGAISKNCQTGSITTGVQFSESNSGSSGSSGNNSVYESAQQVSCPFLGLALASNMVAL